jgi:hypothetical protein
MDFGEEDLLENRDEFCEWESLDCRTHQKSCREEFLVIREKDVKNLTQNFLYKRACCLNFIYFK